MNIRTTHDKHGRQLHDLSAGIPHSIAGRRGTVVRCLTGRLWVTQEGDAQDYVVPPCGCYCSGGNGRIVISAAAENTRIAVYHVTPPPATAGARNRVRVDADFVAMIHDMVRQERARLLSAMIAHAWCHVRRAWRWLMQSRRHDRRQPAGGGC